MHIAVNRYRSLILVAGIIVAITGCEMMPDAEFAALRQSLSLRMVDAKRGASGDSIDVSFELTNRGNTMAEACLGPSRSVDYKTVAGGGIFSSSFDHAGCARAFTLESQGVMSWAETIDWTPNQGPLKVAVDVEITNPRRCDSWGCARFDLRSNQVELP